MEETNNVEMAGPRVLALEFRGNGFEYFKIWIVNVLLTILTLGIYSAWAKVRTNRYFYSNLYLDESNFRYLAQPLTILKGRLIAVAALIAYSFVSVYSPEAGIGLAVLLMIGVPYFVNQSLRFNNRMSAYKNIQFRFRGTYWEAFMVLYIWPILGVLTLGILYPLAILRLNQYVVRNSAYGSSDFDFDASFKDYGIIFLILVGIALVFATPLGILGTVFPEYQQVVTLPMLLVYFGLFFFCIW